MNILNYSIIFFKILFFFIFFFNSAYSENIKIGSITELSGDVISITEDGEERELEVFDEIFLKDEILIGETSSATIQFDDSTTIILKELTSLNVSEFEKSEARKVFQAKLGKGEIIIESGSIAKNKNGNMLVDLSNMSLGVRGTRINVGIKNDGKSKVALAEDSFGDVGEIEISSEGQTTNLTSIDEVIEVTEKREIAKRQTSDEEKEEFKTVNETLVKVSKIDENELEKQLQEKLDKGKLQDANNDGIVDEKDIEVAKEIIKEEKKQQIEFIVENSKDDNTTFLSDVIDQSDEENIGETIEKIIETKDTLVEGVVGNLSDKDNEFITTSTSEDAGLIKEKIFETIVLKETEKSAEILSKVMAKSDEATISSVINNITEKNTNEDSKLSLKVMADFSEKNPEKLEILTESNAEEVEKLTVDAINKASSSNEDVDLIAKVVSGAGDDLVNKVVEEVSKTSTEEKQNLSAKVLKAIVDTEPDKIEIIDKEIKDTMIEQTIESAKNQQEGTTEETEDFSNTVAEIVTKADNETAAKVLETLEEVSKTTDSKLSLNVVKNLTKQENYEEKLEILSVTSEVVENNITKLVEKAVEDAKTEEDLKEVTNIVENSKGTLSDKIIESANNNEESKEKIQKVIVDIIEKDPEKAVEIIEKNESTNAVTETIKTKIENNEAITSKDFDKVFDTNVSPN